MGFRGLGSTYLDPQNWGFGWGLGVRGLGVRRGLGFRVVLEGSWVVTRRARLRGSLEGIFKGCILGGSWDLVSMVISTLIRVFCNYKYSYPNNNPSY